VRALVKQELKLVDAAETCSGVDQSSSARILQNCLLYAAFLCLEKYFLILFVNSKY